MIKHSTTARKGQTLVEALVALTVLTTGLLGIITLLTKSFQLNRITAEQTQATYLAEEGIEITKNIIDFDLYSGLPSTNNWACTFNLSAGGTADYELYYNVTIVNPCDKLPKVTSAQAQSDRLYYHKDTGFYDYTAGVNAVQSQFTRDVSIYSVPGSAGDNELRVRSKVIWSNGVFGDSVTVEDYFYNWHP